MRAFFVPAIRIGRSLSFDPLKSRLLPYMVVLSLVPAVSPLGMTLHIPFIKQIALEFGISMVAAQATVTLYMLVFAIAIFATALVADLIAKRTILLISLSVFALASFLASISSSFEVLQLARIFQALGAGFAVVMPYAIVQESARVENVAKSISTISVFHSLAGSIAPLLGGLLTWFVDFRIALALVSVYACYLFYCVWHSQIGIRTIPHESMSVADILKRSRMLILQKRFFCSLLIISFSSSLYYGFLSVAPIVFGNNFGKSDFYCGLGIFLICAFWTLGNRLSVKWFEDFGYAKSLFLAVILLSSGMVPVLFLSTIENPVMTLVLMLPYATGGGIITPIVISCATHIDPEIPGVASSLMFAFQTLVGAIATCIFCHFHLNNLYDIAIFGLCTSLVCLIAIGLVSESRMETRVETV